MILAKELRHYALHDQSNTEREIMSRNAFPAQEASEKRDADLRDLDKTDGPTITIKKSCYNCRYKTVEHYAIQGDSGCYVDCAHPAVGKKRVGNEDWSTPTWCPVELGKQAEPVAWMVYVASAQNQYVVDDINDAQLVDDCTNHGAEVTPLFDHPPRPVCPQCEKAIDEAAGCGSGYDEPYGFGPDSHPASTAEVEALRKDAERYRLVRRMTDPQVLALLNSADPEPETEEAFDAAVDKAMLAAAKREGK